MRTQFERFAATAAAFQRAQASHPAQPPVAAIQPQEPSPQGMAPLGCSCPSEPEIMAGTLPIQGLSSAFGQDSEHDKLGGRGDDVAGDGQGHERV